MYYDIRCHVVKIRSRQSSKPSQKPTSAHRSLFIARRRKSAKSVAPEKVGKRKIAVVYKRLRARQVHPITPIARCPHALSNPISSAYGSLCKSPTATYVGLLLTRSAATLQINAHQYAYACVHVCVGTYLSEAGTADALYALQRRLYVSRLAL